MAVGDGVVWAESLPDNTTLASEIDDYDRDLRIGVRSRMALEHIWPSAHTGTGSGGRHTYITFQPQAAAPTMAGTTGGGLYVSTEVSPRLIFTRSNASDVTLVNTAGSIAAIVTGTQGSIVIASSANPTGVLLLVASANGLYLKTRSTTNAPIWEAVTSLDAGVIVSGTFGANTVTTTSIKTTLGEVSSSAVSGDVTLPGGTWGFYPQIKLSAGTLSNSGYVAAGFTQAGFTSTSYVTDFGWNGLGGGGTLYVQQRYITASGIDHWLWILMDKKTGLPISMWSAPDHVAYGNGGDFNALPHPFRGYDPEIHEIVLVDKYSCKLIKSEASRLCISLLTLLNRDYKVDMSEELPYIPQHSGRVRSEEGVQAIELVKSIPDYIKVRRLVK